jgi:hypothetical protein
MVWASNGSGRRRAWLIADALQRGCAPGAEPAGYAIEIERNTIGTRLNGKRVAGARAELSSARL